MKIKKEFKGKYSNHSPAFGYFIPEVGEMIKVERVNHHTYVANYKNGPERVFLNDMKNDGWRCIGKWEDKPMESV